MDPYAKPGEHKIGAKRPRIEHLPPGEAQRKTRQQRVQDKAGIAAARRAIKKAARRHLKQQLQSDLGS